MLKTLRLAHAQRAGILLASGLACAVVPAVANASAVDLGTAKPFAVLGASTVTNTVSRCSTAISGSLRERRSPAFPRHR